jgi:hypothetical protein
LCRNVKSAKKSSGFDVTANGGSNSRDDFQIKRDMGTICCSVFSPFLQTHMSQRKDRNPGHSK